MVSCYKACMGIMGIAPFKFSALGYELEEN